MVDDEPLVRMTIADMLRLGGFDVLEAAAGAQALDVLAMGQPVVALVWGRSVYASRFLCGN
ncbi:MAG: hypothetical protein WC684_02410 [Hyphomicrobium sp.]